MIKQFDDISAKRIIILRIKVYVKQIIKIIKL